MRDGIDSAQALWQAKVVDGPPMGSFRGGSGAPRVFECRVRFRESPSESDRMHTAVSGERSEAYS